MRKLISLIIGCAIAYYLYLHWQGIMNLLGRDIAIILLIYVVALGVIHIGGISLKILAVVFAIIEPIADKYCYWYENTKFYRFFHKDEIR
ncbi:MAG: hypothetical protein NC200_00260 [Candidatus Gastranaerophilales bacterium]|nr:hypothetical protein [Candidatus Gastranaerophilales bacterium]